MVVNSKIRDSDWLTFALTIVNFNYVFIQSAPDYHVDPKTIGMLKENKIRVPASDLGTIPKHSPNILSSLSVEWID